jgi:hypothetical protein
MAPDLAVNRAGDHDNQVSVMPERTPVPLVAPGFWTRLAAILTSPPP